jgi:signal transduction histidine kinase
VFSLAARHDSEHHARDWLLAEVRPTRDVVENLLRSPLNREALREALRPLQESGRHWLRVLRADGTPVFDLPPPPREPGEHEGFRGGPPPPLEPDVLRRVAEGEEVLQWHRAGHVIAALPMRLPDGQPGVFYLSGRRFEWMDHKVSWLLVAGLATVLGVLWLLSWPLAVHLARPLQRMAIVADALGQGDLSARIAPRDIQRHAQHRHPRRDEIGRLAESFNRMADNLQRLVLGHKRLLADISHELRSPLARLRLALELARGAHGAEQARYLATLERQADEMEAMIGELLLHARLDQAPYALHAEPLDPGALLAEALAAQRPEAEGKALVLQADVPPGLGPLRADRALLVRALNNALRNAVTYSPPSGTVQVSVRREGGRVSLAVRDQGPGVPAAELERIFDPFVRTDAARSRGTGGVGLGLAIVRRCMEAHGGGASAAPGPQGQGLVLTLWLPELPA